MPVTRYPGAGLIGTASDTVLRGIYPTYSAYSTVLGGLDDGYYQIIEDEAYAAANSLTFAPTTTRTVASGAETGSPVIEPGDELRALLAAPAGGAMVGLSDSGAYFPENNVEAALQYLALTRIAVMMALGSEPPLNGLRNEIPAQLWSGVGWAQSAIARLNGAVRINEPLAIGGSQNKVPYSEDFSWAYWTTTNSTKTPSDQISFRGVSLTRYLAANYYSRLSINLSSGAPGRLVTGTRYLISFYATNLAGEVFVWNSPNSSSGDYGHGGRLVDRRVRRIWFLVCAYDTNNLDVGTNPTLTLGATNSGGPNVLNSAMINAATTFDGYVGGVQLETVESTYIDGVAVIGDSTVAGSSGKKDLRNSKEWTRYAESLLNCSFFNRGVGGERLDQMDARWATDMTPLAGRSKYAVIQGGINDISGTRTLADMQTSINSMVSKATTDGMLPVVCTCTAFAAAAADPTKETLRQSLNSWIRSTFVRVLDLSAVIDDPVMTNYIRRDPAWYGDETHFGDAAKRAVGTYVAAQPFWDFIQPSPYQKVATTAVETPGMSIGSGPVIKEILSATVALDFPSVAAGGQQSLTMTVTGAAVGDSVTIDRADGTAFSAGIIMDGTITAANTVTVRASNITASSVDPTSMTVRATVTRF